VRLPYFTVGHSNRSLDDFARLLDENGIELIVDVRTVPRSRANPQFNKDVLPAALASYNVSYEHCAALGGLRGKARDVTPGVNGLWTNESFHNYADYALTSQFRDALAHLVARGRERRLAMMCAEAVWWRCHRRIIADYLIARDESVFHIMEHGRLEQAKLTPGAVVGADHTVRYPSKDSPDLFDGI